MRCLHHCCTVKTVKKKKNTSEATLGCPVPRSCARRRAVDKVMGGVIEGCALPFYRSAVLLFEVEQFLE